MFKGTYFPTWEGLFWEKASGEGDGCLRSWDGCSRSGDRRVVEDEEHLLPTCEGLF